MIDLKPTSKSIDAPKQLNKDSRTWGEDIFAFTNGIKATAQTFSSDILAVELAAVAKRTSIHMYETTTVKFLFSCPCMHWRSLESHIGK